MNKLSDTVQIRGIGFPGMEATLVKRKGRVAMYLRDDDYYEVGILQVLPAQEVFGKQYPERERYWYTEEFGVCARTTNITDRAKEHFKHYLAHEQSKED